MIPYGRQTITEQDIDAVTSALRADFLTTGPIVPEFESKFAQLVGARYAVAVCNATAALHLAMLVARIGRGDRVITSPNTFLASANCAAFVGATPDFSDIDPLSHCLCPLSLAENWQPDTKAVVAVHYAGPTANMPEIAAIARARGAIVIEDACHAAGGQFEHGGKHWSIGAHPWADMTTFSFHPVKTMTTGEGGMLVTDNQEYAELARSLRSHGMVRDRSNFEVHTDSQLEPFEPWSYEMQHLGHNYRLTDFQAALGISQLSRLRERIERRHKIVQRYNTAFADHPLISTPRLRNPLDHAITSWHLYTVQIDFEQAGMRRTEFMNELADQGVGSQVLYVPVHLQPWYRREYGYGIGKCPRAERFSQRALSLPLFSGLQEGEVERVIERVSHVLGCRVAPNRL